MITEDGKERAERDLQLEEGVRNLKHENVRVSVIMDDQDTFDSPTHAVVLVVVLKTLKTRRYTRIFLRLSFLGAKGCIRREVRADWPRVSSDKKFLPEGEV